MEVVRGLARHHTFSGHMLVLWSDHGRQRQDVSSLAGAGSQVVQLYPDHSIPLMTIEDLEPEDVVVAFLDFMVHVLTQAERGHPVSEDKLWRYARGYIKWFYHVSHPVFSQPAPIAHYTALVPPCEEVTDEQ